MMKKRRIRISLGGLWSAVSSLVIAGLGIALILFAGLSTHITGYSEAEVASAYEARSISAILQDPVNLPHKSLTLVYSKIADDGVIASRMASATIGAVAIICLYIATRMWHGKRVAFLVSVLFGTSSWFLLTARSGVPDISASLSILVIALSAYWMRLHYKNLWSYVALIVALALVVYVPGMIWLVAVGLLVRGARELRGIVQSLPRWNLLVLIGLLVLLVVAPIVFAAVREPRVLLDLLGLPAQLPTITEAGLNLLHAFLSLFAWHADELAITIGALPVLDIVTAVFAALGLYYYWQKRALDRTKLLAGALILAAVLLALGVTSGYAVLLPVIFFLAAGGMAALLSRWLGVFPRNPLARAIGLVAITIVVGLACFYNLRAYFVAAPHADNIRSIYSQRE